MMSELVRQRIRDLFEFLLAQDDQKGIGLLNEALEKADAYVIKVNAMERGLMSLNRFRMEVDEYQEIVVRLDGARRTAWDALISNCTIFNRYFRDTYPEQNHEMPGGLFGYSKEKLLGFDRNSIGDWAGEVANAFFTNRVKGKKASRSSDIESGLQKAPFSLTSPEPSFSWSKTLPCQGSQRGFESRRLRQIFRLIGYLLLRVSSLTGKRPASKSGAEGSTPSWPASTVILCERRCHEKRTPAAI